MNTEPSTGELRVRRLGIDTYREPIVFMRADCSVCRAEGFRAMSRVQVSCGPRSLIATLNVVHGDLLTLHEAGLSESACKTLGAHNGDLVRLSHPAALDSFSAVRRKIYGGRFSDDDLHQIIRDVSAGRYSSVELAAFVTICADQRMNMAETLALTRAMVDAGTRLAWNQRPVVDKHSVGGLPGNRTTPIVVPIVAACGLTIPKTSSRAITSPAGTADTMEVLAPVELTLEHMRQVVDSECGCIVWGGSIALSPADDVLIQVERPLDFDSDAQLAASVISKKIAAGSTHLLIDIPVGPTAKLRSAAAAQALSDLLCAVGGELGLQVRAVQTDGSQPVGRGIGPVLEAIDVLAVLQNRADAPPELRQRALLLAGELLELGGKAAAGEGQRIAQRVLDSGEAWRKFQAICEAQGGLREPHLAPYRRPFPAAAAGRVAGVDNRRLGRVAKLAGAPLSAAAGLVIDARLGDRVQAGQPLYTIHAESLGELEYAWAYAQSQAPIISLVSP